MDFMGALSRGAPATMIAAADAAAVEAMQ